MYKHKNIYLNVLEGVFKKSRPPTGLEPVTARVEIGHSCQLSYEGLIYPSKINVMYLINLCK